MEKKKSQAKRIIFLVNTFKFYNWVLSFFTVKFVCVRFTLKIERFDFAINEWKFRNYNEKSSTNSMLDSLHCSLVASAFRHSLCAICDSLKLYVIPLNIMLIAYFRCHCWAYTIFSFSTRFINFTPSRTCMCICAIACNAIYSKRNNWSEWNR